MDIPVTVKVDETVINEIVQMLIDKGVPLSRYELRREIEKYVQSLDLSKEISRIIVNGGKLHYGKDLARQMGKRLLDNRQYKKFVEERSN